MKPDYSKLIKALKFAIPALESVRRRNYAADEYAYRQGIRTDHLNTDGIKGDLFTFAEEGHKHYTDYTEAINTLGDWIEVLEDAGAQKVQLELFEVPDE